MSEFGIHTPEALAEEVRASENTVEDNWREAFLADKLFHFEHLFDVFCEPKLGEDYLEKLKKDFLEEKRGLNVGERFALAISDKYLGKLHVVELGRSTDPSISGDVDGLKDEYRELLGWMVEKDIVKDELPRRESGRRVGWREPNLPEAQPKLKIMVRNRPLIHTSIEHNDKKLSLAIAKRMVFSLPMESFLALNPAENADMKQKVFTNERSLELVELMLEHHSGGVRPIRTAYYLFTDI